MSAILVLALPAAAAALVQDPDTTRTPARPAEADTIPRVLALDTLLTEPVAQDSAVPPPRLPSMGPVGPSGWEVGVWEWDRQDLLRLPDISLLHLLERLPGVVPVRSSLVGQADAPAVLGGTAGAVTYVVDGFEMDPLTTPTFDASRFPLLALERVRVDRRVTGTTVRIQTLSPSSSEVESMVEAATGDYGVNLFRGTFLAPSVLGGPLAAGFERLATDGFGVGSNHTAGWLKWTFVRDSTGVQLEYRQGQMDRSGVGADLLGQRRDWAVRARTRLYGVRTEGYIGASTVEDEDSTMLLQEGGVQGGVRLLRAFEAPLPTEVRGTVRFRSHPRAPRAEAAVEAWVTPRPWLGIGAEAGQGWWGDEGVTGRWTARGRIGPFFGFSGLAEVSGGAPWLSDAATIRLVAPPDSVVYSDVREGARVGASFDRWGFHVGGAFLRTRAAAVPGFGLSFDPDAARFPAGEATGVEATARIPTGVDPLWLEGWYVGLDAPDTWIYVPRHHWRAGLVYHHLPLPSGNLELYARLEHVFRARMATPCGVPLECPGGATGPGTVGAYRATNLELTIRVLSVRAFFRWENLRNRPGQQDLPGLELPGQRILYGVKWEFRN